MVIEVNDILELKKAHPCGSSRWLVTRTGADIRLKCIGCGHQVLLKRSVVEKKIKKIIRE